MAKHNHSESTSDQPPLQIQPEEENVPKPLSGRTKQRRKSTSNNNKPSLRRGGSEHSVLNASSDCVLTVSKETELGYRSDTSDNEEDCEIDASSATSSSDKERQSLDHLHQIERPVARLKRSISGRFRSSNKILEQFQFTSPSMTSSSPPSSESFIKAIRLGGKDLKKIAKKVPLDELDSEGQSPLHLCASRGIMDAAKLLVRRGANINLQDSKGYTPLMCAAVSEKLDICKYLLEQKNIQVSLVNNQKSAFLHYLVRISNVDEDNLVLYRHILDLCIEKGIDVNIQNAQGESPLHMACLKSNTAAVSFLLERGADCNVRNHLGETSLHYATRIGSIQLVRILMENDADPTISSEQQGSQNPVEAANAYQNTDVLDCFQSLIEEEITLSPMSSRVRLNETITIKQDWLYILIDNTDWTLLFVVLSRQRLFCYRDDERRQLVFRVEITHQSRTETEEGSIIDCDEQLWCFTVCERFAFASTTPEKREEWIDAIDRVIDSRVKLWFIYEQLKSQSKPREKLRIRERYSALEHCREGVRLLSSLKPEAVPKWVVEKIDYSAPTLSEIAYIDNDDFVKSMVKYLLHHDLLEPFLKAAITHDIRKTTMGKTLFRESSLSTKMLSAYLDMKEGKAYLRSTIISLVNAIAEDKNIDLHLTTSGNSSSDRNRDHNRANFEKLINLAQTFLDCVLSSATRVPIIFRELMLHTRKLVDKMFPNMTHAIVGGFIFLRFICPAILSPQKIGNKCWDNPPRVCLLITKVLQTVSNGVEFDGSKEDHMQRFNPFIKKNRLYVNVFFDHLTDEQSIAKCKENQTTKVVMDSSELKLTEAVIVGHIADQRPKMESFLNTKHSLVDELDSDDEPSGVEEDDE